MTIFNKILSISFCLWLVGGFLVWPAVTLATGATGDFGNQSDTSLPGGSQSQVQNGGSVNLPNPLGGTTTFAGLLLKITDFLISDIITPLVVLMIIWAGFKFVTAEGNEEKIKKARQNLVWTITGLVVILAAQPLIGYIKYLLGAEGGSSGLKDTFKRAINEIIGILFGLAVVYFLWGVAEMIRAAGEPKKLEEGKRHMVWGIIGMVIMAGVFGIVTLLKGFLGV